MRTSRGSSDKKSGMLTTTDRQPSSTPNNNRGNGANYNKQQYSQNNSQSSSVQNQYDNRQQNYYNDGSQNNYNDRQQNNYNDRQQNQSDNWQQNNYNDRQQNQSDNWQQNNYNDRQQNSGYQDRNQRNSSQRNDMYQQNQYDYQQEQESYRERDRREKEEIRQRNQQQNNYSDRNSNQNQVHVNNLQAGDNVYDNLDERVNREQQNLINQFDAKVELDTPTVAPDRLKDSQLLVDRNTPYKDRQARKKNKKILHRVFFAVAAVVIAVVGVVVYPYASPYINEFVLRRGQSVDSVRESVADLYTDDTKVDIKEDVTVDDIASLQAILENLDETSSEKEGLQKELETIQQYIEDTNTLDTMFSDDYDLMDTDFETKLGTLRTSVNGYAIPGLAVTISSKISILTEDWRSLQNLVQELVGVSGSTDVDPTTYISTIEDKVTHTPNKEALINVVSYISDKQALVKEIDSLSTDATSNKDAINARKEELKEVQSKINAILAPEASGDDTTTEGAD